MIALIQRVSEASITADGEFRGSIGQGLMVLVCGEKNDKLEYADALAADTNSGTRPSFSPAADPVLGEALYERFLEKLRALGFNPVTGVFGAHMQISLVNDGPVTFRLCYPKKKD